MKYKNELLEYCESIRCKLDSPYSDAMHRAFMDWAAILPEQNLAMPFLNISEAADWNHNYLSVSPDVQIGFLMSGIMEQYAQGTLNYSYVDVAVSNLGFTISEKEPLSEDSSTIFGVEYPVNINEPLKLKPRIIDGNKRISKMIKDKGASAVQCKMIEPHSLGIRCFLDLYSHFIFLYNYDMAVSILNDDHAGVIYTIGVEMLSKIRKNYPALINFLKSESSS